MVVEDLAHQHGANFHLGHRTEIIGVQQGQLPAVLGEHRAGRQGHRPHGVQFAGQKAVFSFGAIVQIAVAVIVVDAQPEHQTEAVPVSPGQPVILQKIREGIAALLHRQDGVAFDRVHRQKAVTGGDQRSGIAVDGAQRLPDLAGEAIVEAPQIVGVKILEVNVVFSHERPDQRFGHGGVQKLAGHLGYRAAGEGFEQHTARAGVV